MNEHTVSWLMIDDGWLFVVRFGTAFSILKFCEKKIVIISIGSGNTSLLQKTRRNRKTDAN
jgi:hypothetical protein